MFFFQWTLINQKQNTLEKLMISCSWQALAVDGVITSEGKLWSTYPLVSLNMAGWKIPELNGNSNGKIADK